MLKTIYTSSNANFYGGVYSTEVGPNYFTGNVGIGETNPIAQLQIGEGPTINGTLYSNYNKQLSLVGTYNVPPNSGSSIKLYIGNYDNDGATDVYPIICEDENAQLDFFLKARPSSTSKPTMHCAGDVGFGTKIPFTPFHVHGEGLSTNQPLVYFKSIGAFPGIKMLVGTGKGWYCGPENNTNTPAYVTYNDSGVGVFLPYGGTAWAANSDLRIKKDIMPLQNAIEKICNIGGYTYRLKSDDDVAPLRVGVIAQEVAKVLPEAVLDHNDILSVQYTNIIPLLIEAIKDQQKMLIQMQNDLIELKNASL